MLKLSIVIPVYNVEKYVEKCMVSCAEQNYSASAYEIIIVNDGTKDKSLEIAENVAKRYSNMYIVSQPNGGLSAARNKGLSLAKGEYVWFIDSDDWIDANCLNSIIEQLNDIDVLAMGYRKIVNDKSSITRVSDESAQDGRCLLVHNMIMPAQFYIYRRSFLEKNDLHFMPGIFHEDFEFTPRMLYYAERLKVYPDIVYNFLKREGSIATSVNPKKSFDLVKVAAILSCFSVANVEIRYKQNFNNLISLAFNNSLSNSLMMSSDDKKSLSEMFCKSKSLFLALRKSSLPKYRFEGLLFSLFPCHCLQIFSLQSKIRKILF